MSNNLEKLIAKIRKAVDQYPELNEAKKIDAAIFLKKSMSKCKKTITNYLGLIENVEAHLTESPIDSDEEINFEKKFRDDMKKIKDIMNVFEIKKDKLTIDEKISLYVDLVKYTNNAKDYLDKKKEVLVEYL
jgi:hypothetical protein